MKRKMKITETQTSIVVAETAKKENQTAKIVYELNKVTSEMFIHEKVFRGFRKVDEKDWHYKLVDREEFFETVM